MKIAEAMTRDIELVSPEATIEEAARVMADLDATAVLVGKDDVAAGILTDRDIIIRVVASGSDPGTLVVRRIMTSTLVTCREDDDAAAVAATMRARQIRRMPVVNEDGTIAGLVCLDDIDAAIANRDGETGHATLLEAAGNKPRQAPPFRR